MAPSLHLTALLAVFSIYVAASNVDEQALVQRPPLAGADSSQYAYVAPNLNFPPPPSPPSLDTSIPNLANDYELLDTILVASIDGKFHALNRTSGQTLWSMSSFATTTSVSAPSSLAPLVRTTHPERDPDLIDDPDTDPSAGGGTETYIIEPQSGDIYMLTSPSEPLQRFPFSMAELVDISPFTSVGEHDTKVFVGRKETSLLVIELETGRIKATLNAECPFVPEEYEDLPIDLDELEGIKPPISAPTEVYIGRTDYHISIHKKPQPGKPAPVVQELSFSTYGPNNKDAHLQAIYRRTHDNTYLQPLPNGEVIAFRTRNYSNPAQPPEPEDGVGPLWGRPFPNTIVAIFDVLRARPTAAHPFAHPRGAPFVLLQPQPALGELVPGAAAPPHPGAAYVGVVEETGSLYALSPGRFPLVVFGSGERHGIGRAKGVVGKKTLDAPVRAHDDAAPQAERGVHGGEGEGGEDGDAGAEVCARNPYAAQCLVGVRPLAKADTAVQAVGRLKHLIDAPKASAGGGENTSGRGGPPAPVWHAKRIGDGTGGALARGWAGAEVWLGLVVLAVLAVGVWVRSRVGRGKGGRNGARVREAVVDRKEKVERKEEVPPTPTPAAAKARPAPIAVDPEMPPNGVLHGGVLLDTPRANRGEVQNGANLSGGGSAGDEGEESEGEGEGGVPATPGKRKSRRGKRGKKKKAGAGVSFEGEKEEDKDKDKAKEKEEEKKPSAIVLTTSSPKPVVQQPSLIVSDTILGFGSHGTVVFQGSLQGRAVAVKRLLQDFVTLASREVSILQESDDHPNVIRYYYQEAHANFLYIALELCPASLADIIEAPDREAYRDIALNFDPKRALRQIASGLRHLHALKLVHRDIKPQNILVGVSPGVPVGRGGKSYRMLISDFGLCKRLDVDQTSFLPTAHGALGAGTVGWRAPEILRGDIKLDEVAEGDESLSSRGSVATVSGGSGGGLAAGVPARLTKSVDIFALGCLFYYTLTSGGHPYGDRFEREVNIMRDVKDLSALERFGEEGTEATDLISGMLSFEARARPDTTTILLHPFFWDAGRRLNFLQDASDRFEIMPREPKDPNLLVLEQGAHDVVGNDWATRLDKIFLDNLGKYRKYDGKSVQDLMRALRNKKHHYQDLPDNVKRHLGPMPEGFLGYFTRRYPMLFLHVHRVVRDTGLHTESMFRTYFELPDN
ncbi:hypothetical protein BJ912DRAFT_889548 [Pholiota molesta]|nr:hypothetical protein BJ912DRAFT_889548 [Pholiota molesta]